MPILSIIIKRNKIFLIQWLVNSAEVLRIDAVFFALLPAGDKTPV